MTRLSECDTRTPNGRVSDQASARYAVSCLLALEIKPSWWPSQDRPRDPRPDCRGSHEMRSHAQMKRDRPKTRPFLSRKPQFPAIIAPRDSSFIRPSSGAANRPIVFHAEKNLPGAAEVPAISFHLPLIPGSKRWGAGALRTGISTKRHAAHYWRYTTSSFTWNRGPGAWRAAYAADG